MPVCDLIDVMAVNTHKPTSISTNSYENVVNCDQHRKLNIEIYVIWRGKVYSAARGSS